MSFNWHRLARDRDIRKENEEKIKNEGVIQEQEIPIDDTEDVDECYEVITASSIDDEMDDDELEEEDEDDEEEEI